MMNPASSDTPIAITVITVVIKIPRLVNLPRKFGIFTIFLRH